MEVGPGEVGVSESCIGRICVFEVRVSQIRQVFGNSGVGIKSGARASDWTPHSFWSPIARLER